MDRLLVTLATAALALVAAPAAQAGMNVRLTGVPSLVHKVDCDACEDFLEAVQEAREAAAERAEEAREAAEERAEEAAERGLPLRGMRRSQRSQALMQQAARKQAMQQAADAKRRAAAEALKRADNDKPADKDKPVDKDKASETKTADKASEAKASSTVVDHSESGCKQYLASVGMTVSVPCE